MGGLNAISYRDILAWIEVDRPYFIDELDRSNFADILFALDKEYLTLIFEKSEKP